MSANQPAEARGVASRSRELVRDRVTAEEVIWASQQGRAHALLRTVTAIAAFVVAGLAYLRSRDIELTAASVTLVTITFFALGGAIVATSLALIPKRLARPGSTELAGLLRRIEAGESDEDLLPDVVAYETSFLEQVMAANDTMERLLRLAFLGEILAACSILASLVLVIPSL